VIYLDSAAIVKLAHAEAGSGALRDWLDQRTELDWVSSVLAEVESFRALARHAPAAAERLPSLLDLIDLIGLDAGIRLTAQAIAPASVRSLDAIHLATALHLRPRLATFITYDRRLADAGLPIAMPADLGGPR
jgi:predicted nucleic acid-binding protein